jgi:ribosomal protein S18 acetylase RimI-like enzyme
LIDTNSTSRGIIRPTVAADLPALKTIISVNQMFPAEMLDNMIGSFLAGEAAEERWLTVDDDGPIAVAYHVPERMTDGTYNLLLIAVHPDRHGNGIGAALMRHVEHDLAARGGRLLLVETSGGDEYARTRGFYRHLGYTEEARIREYYAAGEDKVIFRRAL